MSDVPLIGAPSTTFEETEPKYIFVKPDLKPGDKKYYEVEAVQLTAEFLAQNPGYKVVTKEQPGGQAVEASDWVIARTDATDGTRQEWPLKDHVFSARWKPVPDKPGYYSPRSVPTTMVELPLGGKVATSWGEAEGGPGSFLAKYGEGDFNVITAKDLVSTYEGTDDLSRAKLAEIIAKGL
jgi:hypothetical protein